MKKFLSILMSVVMIISCFGMSGFGAYANTDATAPVIAVGEKVSISINTESIREENTEYFVKFVPDESAWFEFTLLSAPTSKGGIIIGTIFDEDLAPVGDGSICYGSYFVSNFTCLSVSAQLKAGETYYLYVSGSGAGKYTSDVTVKKGHTHNYSEITIPASVDDEDSDWSSDGEKFKICISCGSEKTLEKYYYPKTITLSSDAYSYNGEYKKPKVTVKDRKGNVIGSSNYTVKYSNNKNVGIAKVTVKFNDKKYEGVMTKTFKINPAKTNIKSLSAGSKKFTVKWTKKTTQVSGYQIQYSTSSKFSSAKTVTVKGTATTSNTVKNLKAKKKYYVRVRTYKTVTSNGKSTKYYSDWSSYKTVTTKK